MAGKESKWHKVSSGIPQGSVLEPLLFVLYINDLPELTKSDAFLFSDGIKIFTTVTNKHDQDILQHDLNILEQWSDKWLLKCHSDKCKPMTVGKNEVGTIKYSMTLNDTKHPFDTIEKQKDLGVTVDTKLPNLYRFNKIAIPNNKFQMASGQGSHWLIESPTIFSSMCSPPLSNICQFYF